MDEKLVTILKGIQKNYNVTKEEYDALKEVIDRASRCRYPGNISSIASFKAFDYVDGIVDGGTPTHPWNDLDVEKGYETGFIDGVRYRSEIGLTVPGILLDGYLYTHFSPTMFDMGEKTRIPGAPTEGDAIDVNVQIIEKGHEHNFDYRGLIPMDLAPEAPEEMYKDN